VEVADRLQTAGLGSASVQSRILHLCFVLHDRHRGESETPSVGGTSTIGYGWSDVLGSEARCKPYRLSLYSVKFVQWYHYSLRRNAQRLISRVPTTVTGYSGYTVYTVTCSNLEVSRSVEYLPQ
jgi:hypothetical protein